MRVLRLPAIRLIFSVMDLCSEEQSNECNNQAIRKFLEEGKLELRAVPNFQEFLSDGENTIGLIGWRSGSVILWGFESIFVNFQALDLRFEGLCWQS